MQAMTLSNTCFFVTGSRQEEGGPQEEDDGQEGVHEKARHQSEGRHQEEACCQKGHQEGARQGQESPGQEEGCHQEEDHQKGQAVTVLLGSTTIICTCVLFGLCEYDGLSYNLMSILS